MKSLASSRKFWIALSAMICVTVVVIVCLLLKVPTEAMVVIAGTIGGLAFKLIGAIAMEDAANKAPLAIRENLQ